MLDYLDKYRASFDQLQQETRVFRSHLSMIRDHFREVEKMMVETGLGMFNWAHISDSQGETIGYLLFDNLVGDDGQRQGPGHLSVYSDLQSFDREDPRSDPRMHLIRVEDAPYQILIRAYAALPLLVDSFLFEVAEESDRSSSLEEKINEFRDAIGQYPERL